MPIPIDINEREHRKFRDSNGEPVVAVSIEGDDGLPITSYNKLTIGNARNKFRDGFDRTDIAQPDTTVWDYVNDDASATGHIVSQGGNSSASGYLRISLSPFLQDSGVILTTIDTFSMPLKAGIGLSLSQRIVGQEIAMELVGVDVNEVVETITPVDDIAMPASVTVAVANTCPIITATPHGLHGGDRVVIYGCLDSRVNAGPLVVTVLTATSFSVPVTLAVATFNTTGGYIKWVDPLAYAKNATSLLYENATATNASFLTRRNGGTFRSLNSTIATTLATQVNLSPYTDAYVAASQQEIFASMDEVGFRSFASDGLATMSGIGKWTQGIPDEEKNYKLRIRAKNLKNLTVPVARILTASKSASTTATFTTDVEHGLTIGDFIQVYGVRDQGTTFFPNLVTAVVVTGVPTTSSFTCICGTSGTTSSTGGAVWRVNGSNLAPGVIAGSIQSISRTSNVLSVVNGSTWTTPLPGEYYQLWGMDAGGAIYDGAYKVLRVATTTLELESIGDDFGSTNCGGVGFKRTDVRIHFAKEMDYTRLMTEIIGGKGNTSDINNSVPVAITASATLPGVTTVTTVTDITRLNNYGTTPSSTPAFVVTTAQNHLTVIQGNINNCVGS